MVAEEFAKTVGPLTPADKDDRLINKMKMLEASMMDKAWLYRKGKRAVERSVKIRAGLEVKHRLHKATGGLIRADYALEDGKMKDVCISGDFFLFSRQCRRPFGGPAGRVHVRQHRKCDC
jgi:hypothetical protein